MSIRRAIGVTFPTRNLSAIESDPDELRHGAQISIWVRWIILVGVMAEVNYRVDYGAVSHILNTLYVAVRHGTQRICALAHPVEQGHWCPLAPASQLCGCGVRLFQYFTIRWAWQQILRPLLLCCDIFRDNFHIPASECVMGYCGGSHICGPVHTGCSRYQSCRRPG